MEHAGREVPDDLDARGPRARHERLALVEQDLGAARLHEQRRQAGELRAQQREARVARLLVARVVAQPADQQLAVAEVDVRMGVHGAALRQRVHPRAQQRGGRRQRIARVAQAAQGGERERPARGVARQRERSRVGAAAQQPAHRGEAVVVRGREAVLGPEAVVDAEHPRGQAEREARQQVAVRLRRAEHVAAAVEVHDGATGSGAGRRAPDGPHAARVHRLPARLPHGR